MEYVARPFRFEPDHVNGQWINYLDVVGDDLIHYPSRGDGLIVFTNAGAFDAVVDDVDSTTGGYYIVYIAPINESIDLTGKVTHND
jgi:hypothetical protein